MPGCGIGDISIGYWTSSTSTKQLETVDMSRTPSKNIKKDAAPCSWVPFQTETRLMDDRSSLSERLGSVLRASDRPARQSTAIWGTARANTVWASGLSPEKKRPERPPKTHYTHCFHVHFSPPSPLGPVANHFVHKGNTT